MYRMLFLLKWKTELIFQLRGKMCNMLNLKKKCCVGEFDIWDITVSTETSEYTRWAIIAIFMHKEKLLWDLLWL